MLIVGGGTKADASAFDDLSRHRAEPGAPMNAALQHHVALLQWVDAEAQEAIEIGGLNMV